MREAAQFVLGILVEAPPGTPFAGRLVTNPSTSPENQYVLGGRSEHLTYAPTMDIELIRELFDNTRQAGELLDADANLRRRMEQARDRLPPLQVGKRGQLQEWIVDYPEAEPAHRHVSHLYSLYPGHDIALETTPEWAAAAKKTLEIRGDGGTGWSEVWRTASWARLGNAERAYANLVLLINNNTLPNLFDLCPPFQIDGNLGAPAAMMEMLVQSKPGQIRVLPALPRQWPNGYLRGVRVRGGARVDVSWKDARLVEVVLRSDSPTVYQVGYGEISAEARVDPAHPAVFDGGLRRVGGISAR
jgi:alpha-L-fucosidase 2